MLAAEPDGTHLVVDYKTDRIPEDATPAEYIARGYETQRLVYALAALRAGAPRVDVAYCLLERPDEPVTTSYAAGDAPELANALQQLARGVIEHEFARPPPRTASCAATARAARRSAATRRA